MSREGVSNHLDNLINDEYEKAKTAVKKEASEKSMKKTAGEIKGPGVPDGTGPMKDSPECPMKDKEVSKKSETEGETKEADTKEITKMSFFDARQARRSGQFVKVAGRHDLYQDTETKDLWKVSETKDSVERTFDESEGIVND